MLPMQGDVVRLPPLKRRRATLKMARWNGTARSRVSDPEYVRKMDPGVPPLPLWVHGASWEPNRAYQGALLSGLPRFSMTRTGAVPFLTPPRKVICLTSLQWCRITSLKECHSGFWGAGRHGADWAALDGRFPRERRHGMAGTDKRKQ